MLQNFCSHHHFLSSSCAEMLAHNVTLDVALKFVHNPPVTLDMSMVTWIFSSLDRKSSSIVFYVEQIHLT